MLLITGLLLSSCGEDRTAKAGDPPGTPTRTKPVSAKQVRPVRGGCRAQLGGFLDSMASLRRALARGLSFDEYLPKVRAVRTVYDRIPATRLRPACLLLAGGPAERAFDLYIDAANSWGNCLATTTCGTASVEPKLQRKWALASSRLSAAQESIRRAG
jgi:hypothetical protein